MSDLPRGQAWQTDPEAAFVQARRLIRACAEQKGAVLYLGSLELDRLPSEISALTWLRELRMFGGSICDFTALTPLINLELLEIGSLKCPFPGLDFMRDWDRLQDLDIITPSAVDVKPAAACLGLKRLTIWCTPRRVDLLNLETLSGLRAIEHVSFYGMASERFDTLTQWPRLKFVQLTNPTLETLAGFERLTQLESLSISGASISNLSPLAGLASLKQLIVHDTEVSDLSPLVRLHQLEELNISGTPICELEPLERLGACQREFNQRQRSEQAYWWGDKGLRDIRISRSKVVNLAPLANIETLEHIDLSDTVVASLSSLHHKDNLRHVTLARSAVTDLGPRGSLAGLHSIDLAETSVENLLALEPAEALGSLNISHTQISDLAPLRLAYECRSLNLRGSLVADLKAIIDTGSQEADHRYSQESLDFRDTPAARVNDRFAELAALADESPASCFFETKRYLRELMGIPAKVETRNGSVMRQGDPGRTPSSLGGILSRISLAILVVSLLYLVLR